MTRRRPAFLVLFSISLLTLLSALAWAQYGASLQGTVLDQSGAVVPGASITVTDQATGVARTGTSGDSGFYRVPGLAPGAYKIEVVAQGFKTETITNVTVAAETVKGQDVTLHPAQEQQTVTVVGSNPELQTETATVDNTINSQQVVDLPQFGRDPYQLVRLSPGVFGDASRQGNGNSQAIPQQVGPGGSNSQIFQTENQVQAIANGQRVSANNFMLDGVSVNSLEWGGAAVVTPNQESVQEMNVASASYSAQDGRNSGAQVKVISKSGANNFHGSAFFKINDKGLNAFNKFYGPTNIPLTMITCESATPSEFSITASHCPERVDQKYRDYAGSIGGPILKNKLFFFFSYEGVRLNNTVPVRSVTLERNVLDYDWGVFDLTVPNSSSGDQYNGRVDFTHGNNQFFVSTYIVRLNNFNGGQRPLQDLTLQPHNYAGTVVWTRIISSTMLNELRANFTRYDFNQLQPTGSTNYGIPQIRLFDFDIGGFGSNDNLIGIPQSGTTPGALAQNTYALAETLSWTHNKHAWKFGFQGSRMQNNNNEPGAERPQYQFRALLNFANDACCFYEQVQVSPTGGPLNGQRYFRTNDYGLFAQDDWKIRPNLTLNLGLRWEYFSPLTEAHGTLSNYLYGSQGFINGFVCGPVAPLQPCPNGDQLYNSSWHNFGPRFGFAWSPDKYAGKVVFRGGFSVIFNRNSDVVFDNVRQDTPYSALASSCCFFDPGPIVGPPPGSNILYALGSSNSATSFPINPAYSNGVAPDGALCSVPGCASTQPVSLFGALPNEPNPYVYVFSYEAQVEPVRDLVFKMGYQGSRSRKLVRTIDLNRINPGDTFDGSQDKFQNDGSNGQPCGSTNPTCSAPHATGNARFTNLYFPLPDVNASYDALVVNLTQRFRRGVQFGVNYSWSHAIDTASYEIGYQQTDPSNQALNRASSDFNVSQNFVANVVWELPIFRGRHDLMGSLLGGWTISGIMSKHTGFPFSALIGSCNTNADRNGDGYCPDLPFAYFGGAIQDPSKQQWINGIFPSPSTEFDTTTLGPGCRCRNIFTGPGYTSIDLTAGKDFALRHIGLGEAAMLAIRANFFNAFNILNLAPLIPATAPTDIINTGQFGHAPDGLAGRVIEFQARLSF
jgi:hypothetical protein